MSGEAASRAHLDLPGKQREFAEAVFEQARAAAKPVIVVLFSGRPLVVPWLVEKADAVLAAWFLGSEAGNAIGDVLTGRVSPSGRTPVTWARAAGQIPIFFGERPTGRPANPQDHYTSKYLDVPNEPLFPFRPRAHLWTIRAVQSARDPGRCRGHRHHADSRRRAQ